MGVWVVLIGWRPRETLIVSGLDAQAAQRLALLGLHACIEQLDQSGGFHTQTRARVRCAQQILNLRFGEAVLALFDEPGAVYRYFE